MLLSVPAMNLLCLAQIVLSWGLARYIMIMKYLDLKIMLEAMSMSDEYDHIPKATLMT